MKRSMLMAAVLVSGLAFAQGNKPASGDKAMGGDNSMTPDKGKAADKAMKPEAGASGQGAQPAQGGMPDMSKMGPWSRKPKNEAAIKKEVQAFFKQAEAAHTLEAAAAMNDFPVFMATDDATGKVTTKEYTREQWVAEMKPFFDNMPKDMKTTHKPNITVLSDNLVLVTDDFAMGTGKQKMTGKNGGLLIKKDGKWLWKSMVEAGWGGMSSTN